MIHLCCTKYTIHNSVNSLSKAFEIVKTVWFSIDEIINSYIIFYYFYRTKLSTKWKRRWGIKKEIKNNISSSRYFIPRIEFTWKHRFRYSNLHDLESGSGKRFYGFVSNFPHRPYFPTLASLLRHRLAR